jgi:two-component system cell cycle sensor histidine kinase/response regulator CckA
VAHDFNNILAGILGHVSYLKMILPGAGPHVESLAAVEEGAKKASSITQQILNFSRLDPSERPTRLDLNSLVGRTVGLLRGAISPEYNLECAAASRPIGIVAVEGKMAQVIINLAINARDAIATNGKILVAVGECSDPGELAEAFGGSDLSARRYAVLSVTDNGSGMPPEVVGRIFEPYFSTKKGRGTGLGLSTVAAIVREFGGAIVVDSAVGRGTTFAVYFPLLEAEASGASADLDDAALPRGTERILIVDDEYPIRNVLSVSLQHLGYAVDTAASGSEALEKYIRPGDYDLVLLDMLMPVLSGEETFFKLRSVDSAARVLVISGYTSERSVRNILEHGGLDFLPKPFTIDDLSRKVRECIDDPERHA